jgi:hypothetical protein
MDPTTAPNEYQALSGNDIRALTVLGWTPSDITIAYKPGGPDGLPGPYIRLFITRGPLRKIAVIWRMLLIADISVPFTRNVL